MIEFDNSTKSFEIDKERMLKTGEMTVGGMEARMPAFLRKVS